ncbi:cadherin-like beta sandwich domain-containing protein [Cohnella suwonensis]|uniref:Cadherin-like beta sandwich domain-containing protein n=1 Tax=Cohnella suwonensis TaxID=696072 RepID=A0ABW0LWC0_9BACL
MIKKVIPILLSFLIGISAIGSFAGEASAASSRVAVIKEMKGTVKVKKAGGSKEFTAFAKMSLSEGDILAVGANGSAVLAFANGTSEDDRMTVSANSTLTFSKLSNSKGTTTKVSLYNGKAWVDVKSISSKDDEFTLETPTAIMGVRGTHLLVTVDPVSGATHLTVAAGVVNTKTTDPLNPDEQNVYPTQNALISKDDKEQSEVTIAAADVELLMKQSDGTIASAILKAAGEIQIENDRKMDQYLDELAPPNNDPEKDRVITNVENILGAIADQALSNGLITQTRLKEILAEVKAQSGTDIDLNKKTISLSDEEKRQQEEQRKKDEEARLRALEQKEQEEKERQQQLVEKLEKERKEKEEENKKKLKEKNKEATEQYEQQLSEAERKRFEEENRQRDLEQNAGSATSTSGSTSTVNPSASPSGSPSGIPSPDIAVLDSITIKPTTVPIESYPQVSMVSGTTNYSLSDVANGIRSMLMTPVAHAGASVAEMKVNGEEVNPSSYFSLIPGDNSITFKVIEVANPEHYNTYTFTVNRAVSSNASISEIMVEGYDSASPLPSMSELTAIASPGAAGTYVVIAPSAIKSVAIQLLTSDVDATVEYEGTILSTKKTGRVDIPAGGTKNFTFSVKASNQSTTTTYTVIVDGVNGNATLSGIEVKAPTGLSFAIPTPPSYTMIGNVDETVEQIKINPAATRPGSKVEVLSGACASMFCPVDSEGYFAVDLKEVHRETEIAVKVTASNSSTIIVYYVKVKRGILNNDPSGISLNPYPPTIAENLPIDAIVGTLAGIDLDAGDTFSYALVSGAGDADNASFQIVGNQLKSAQIFDYEVKSSYLIRIRVTDQVGFYFDQAYTVNITDVPEGA